MAPVRRYLRISKYSVLECRIYLDNPALAHSWLLHPRDPVLPKVIEAVRPFVLPKLREERERSRKKSAKKRGIKDTVTHDDFEVSVFLTETSTRHSLLFKHKHFRDTTQTKLTSNASKLTGDGASWDVPIDVEDQLYQQQLQQRQHQDAPAAAAPPGLRIEDEDDDNDVIALRDIPTLGKGETTAKESCHFVEPHASHRRSHLRRGNSSSSNIGGGSGGVGVGIGIDGKDTSMLDNSAGRLVPGDVDVLEGSKHESASGSDLDPEGNTQDHDFDYDDAEDEEDSGGLFVDQDLDHDHDQETTEAIPTEVRRKHSASGPRGREHGPEDDKKKLAMDISYEGFSIYGRVLCLVVKRRENGGGGIARAGSGTGGGRGGAAIAAAAAASASSAGRSSRAPSGQATMENWIASTQTPDAGAGGLLYA
ncbi:hypothetical protein BD289DRAFT_480480 [Coniella lustricola]|uniref:Uncharacterized protein n=1 Tax=Coniella lustricola TaxID=2025994 RepID=A0A2T3AFC8_9PEZI|nr:hypothetical protein BD289DRAFT_480480 [Coniella lustricola]